jgi:hypothetical protein
VGVNGGRYRACVRGSGDGSSKGASSDVSDDVAVAHGLQQLAATVTQQLSDPKASIGRSEQFPENLAADISQDEFETWVRLLLASPKYAPKYAHLLHSGLLVPIVHYALKTAHPAAQQLWELVYPFHRGRPSGTRFVEDGIDVALYDLHDPEVDDDTGRRNPVRSLARLSIEL